MQLAGKKIAILAEDNYEPRELWVPYYRLKEEGAEVLILGTGKASYSTRYGLEVKPDMAVDDAQPAEFAGVVIPGGYAPDAMRRHKPLTDFVKTVFEQNGVVGFICHAGWVAISAGIVKGKRCTSFASIKDDMINAGAEWLDEACVRDGNLISSRVPSDLPDFNRNMIAALAGK
ncbi:MAG: type 1 glutamine amidotransferase domain-containing protein [Gammaproteobacteria bacterium]